MRVLKKLFSNKNQGISGLITVIGLAIGIWILLIGWQVSFDFSTINDRSDNTFIAVNKQVSFLNTMGVKNSFSESELDELSAYKGIEQIAPFLSNNFKVRASSPTLGFTSEFFFESLPDNFLKNIPNDYSWNVGDQTIPIIIPRQYISLYNFGFAPSQGLPQVSPDLIQRFGFDIEIRGRVTQASFKGKIVGVTDQANTILVPQDFLVWANDRFAGSGQSEPSRIAILCDANNQVAVKKKLEASEYEINSNQFVNEKSALILNLLFIGIMLIGFIILSLAVFLVYNSLEQLIGINQLQIRRLFQLGKSTSSVINYFIRKGISTINFGFGIGILSFVLSAILLKTWIINQGVRINKYPHWSIYVIIVVVFLLLNFSMRRRIKNHIIKLFE